MRWSSKVETESKRKKPPAQPYVYPPAGDGTEVGPPPNSLALWYGSASFAPDGVSEEELQAREQRAHARGFQEGQAHAGAEFAKDLAAEREILARALRDFAAERQAYYERVEEEVVHLAVAIARKILHRESQVDPMLLAGVARVALEKMNSATTVKLRIHPSRAPAWREFFARQTDLHSLPQVVEDSSCEDEACVLETEMGSTDLSVEAQLKEIEQGFCDLLARRPKNAA